MSLSWENASWASGEKVAEWIDAQHFAINGKGSIARRLWEWRKGAQASFWALDSLLSFFGHHVSELPGEAWEARRVPRTHDLSPRYCKRCGDEIARGTWQDGIPEPPAKYQRRVYCSPECRAVQTEERICQNCGESFLHRLNQGHHKGKYCSQQCSRTSGVEASRERRRAERQVA